MRVQTKVIVLVLFVAGIFVSAVLAHSLIASRTLGLVLKQNELDKNEIFDKLLHLKSQGLEIFAFDYTYWDEMVAFVNDPENKKEWAVQNIDPGLANFGTNIVWVFDLAPSLVYSVNNLDDAGLKKFPLPAEEIRNIFSGKRFCHFFVNTGRGLVEVRGSTIHHTADPQRKEEPSGYFFAARVWDDVYLGDLARLTGAVLELTHFTQRLPALTSAEIRQGMIRFSRQLPGPDNQPLMNINASFRSEEVMLLDRQNAQYFLLFLFFAVAVIITVVIFVFRWISVPLRLISRSLETEDPGHVRGIEKSRTEFGRISRMIDKFFRQRSALLKGIKERRRAEEQLRIAYEQLKQTQAQLVQSAKMASLGQLSGGLAHEINNPMTGVLNNIQLIKIIQQQGGNISVSEFKEMLDSIEESALRCTKITRSLLEFSRASKGQLERVSLNEAAIKALMIVEYEMKLENISVHKELDPDLPPVLGNFQLLQQVVFDIIANAKWAIEKKSGKNGGTVSLKTEYDPLGRKVAIFISDTGIGITPEHLAHIFEPFFTTKGIGEGTGLGLSIVYGIIKEHGGEITVESKESEGTTFKITLPVAKA